LDLIADVYGVITRVYRATSVKVAEAAKVIENTQRDINIALMNELALIFDKMDISVYDVLEAAGTKWNFLKFYPGLVGGHCIGVDPYYLTYKAQTLGYHPEVILSGRRTNDYMPHFVVDKVIKELLKRGNEIKKKKFALLGITFKENVPDSRNSKSALIYYGLKAYGLDPIVYDPLAYADEVEEEYKIKLASEEELAKSDILIISVAHSQFKSYLSENLSKVLNPGGLIFDVKKILDGQKVVAQGFQYLSL
jgi:UDP-N-acetyl-D-galactosamine dehydrogenase